MEEDDNVDDEEQDGDESDSDLETIAGEKIFYVRENTGRAILK